MADVVVLVELVIVLVIVAVVGKNVVKSIIWTREQSETNIDIDFCKFVGGVI